MLGHRCEGALVAAEASGYRRVCSVEPVRTPQIEAPPKLQPLTRLLARMLTCRPLPTHVPPWSSVPRVP